MLKKAMIRGMHSFMYAVGISLLIYGVIMSFTGNEYTPVLPEFAQHFDNTIEAFAMQLILTGIASGSLGAGSVIMEMERLSLLTQSLIYFVITSFVWVLVGCYCWGLHKYPLSMLGVGSSYVVSYVISWIIQYRICKKSIEEINCKINELHMEGE